MNIKVKPFLKWAGGKGQLLEQISNYYPFEKYNIRKYAEPFVGGGAVLFDILNKYDLDEIYISDINFELINTYNVILKKIDDLIYSLKNLEKDFLILNTTDRKIYYNQIREKFNNLKITNEKEINVELASLMIFLNKTCFNGLYRVNKKDLFNVPIGNYKNPLICDSENLKAISIKLKKVNIIYANYNNSKNFIDKNTFVYLDPPYRAISNTSNFSSYTKEKFDDNNQKELKEFFKILDSKGAKLLLSNSDPKNYDINDNFFDNLYSEYKIKKVEAKRMINCNAQNRGSINELFISNF